MVRSPVSIATFPDVRLVRGRLPLRGGETEAGRSRDTFPGRQLPTGPALRGGIAGPRLDL